ncbi:MAG: DUF2092 domain-containing protein [Xanthomonadales bacterium]|nr:DUF2092 domain-containing protein [Xanthomonadales bacterium]
MTKNNSLAKILVGASVVGAVLFSSFTMAQDTPATASTPATSQQIKDQRALDLLRGMSDTLAKAQTMSFRVRSLVPFAAPSGQHISLFGSSLVAMQRPNKLFVETGGDLFPHKLYFNGKTVTTVGADQQFYAQETAPTTVEALIQTEHPGSDALAPFVDLLAADPYARLTQDSAASALVVGQSTIEAVNTDHLAFSGNGVDWEIWIGAEDKLPRLMVVHYRSGELQPTFTAVFSDWQLGAPTPAETFDATIPKDAEKIEFKLPVLQQSE